MHIIIVTKDMLPAGTQFCLPDSLRLWGIGEGLKQQGYTVSYLMPESNYGVQAKCKCTGRIYRYHTNNLNSMILSLNPDVVVVQDWHVAELITCRSIPLVIDLAGMEDHVTCTVSDQIKKIHALQKGDMFICSSEQEKWFYINFLMQSGFDVSQNLVRVVPHYYPESFLKQIRRKKELSKHPVFVTYWDSYVSHNFTAVSQIINTLSITEQGYYNILSGASTYEYDLENFLVLYNDLASNQEQFAISELITWKELREFLHHSDIGVFLEVNDVTTQMTVPDRAIQYLCAGLPIVCAKGTQLATLIEKYNAGWSVYMSDSDSICSCINMLIDSPEFIEKARAGVTRLLAEHISCYDNVLPLSDFCNSLKKADRTSGGMVEHLLNFSRNVVNIQNPLLNDIYIENILVMVSGSWNQLADCLDLIDIMFPLSNVTLLCPDVMLLDEMELTADCELIIYEKDFFCAEHVRNVLLHNDTERFDLAIALFDNQYAEDNVDLKDALLASGAKYKVGFTSDQNFVLLEDSIEKCIVEVLDQITEITGSMNS